MPQLHTWEPLSMCRQNSMLRTSCLTLEMNLDVMRWNKVHTEDCEGWWLWGLVVVKLLWLSGRALAAQAREVSWVRLPATAGFFTFLYFRLITSKFIYRFSRFVNLVFNFQLWQLISRTNLFSRRPSSDLSSRQAPSILLCRSLSCDQMPCPPRSKGCQWLLWRL